MLAEMVRQDQIANDLANASTPGYKADRTTQRSFGDLLLAEHADRASRSARSATASQIDAISHRLHRRSRSRETGEPLDFADRRRRLLRRPDRAGRALHAQRPVHRSPQGRSSTARATRCSAGTASRSRSAPTARSTRAQLGVFDADQPAQGRRQPRHRHRRRPRPPGQVRAGALEGSGADPARSMVDMIASLRAFEAGQKVIHDDRRDARQGRQPGRLAAERSARRPTPLKFRARGRSGTRSKRRLDRMRKPGSNFRRPMLEGLYTAAAGMAAQQQRIDARRQRPGERRTRPATSTCASASATSSTRRPAAAAGDVRSRRRRRGHRRSAAAFAQGALRETGKPLDVAIEGEGFLHVRRADGRDGAHPRRRAAPRRAAAASTTPARRARSQPADHGPRRRRRADVTIAADGTVTAAGRRARPHPARRRPRARRRCSPSATTSSRPTAASGAPTARRRRTTLTPGRARGLERRRRRRDGRDDRRAARLPARRRKAIQTQDQMLEIANGVKR